LEIISQAINKLDAEYQVIRAPVGRPDLYQLFQKNGFYFVETMYHSYFDFSKQSLILRNNEKDVYYSAVESQENLDSIYAHVKGGMFENDRISLDPYFGELQAANRYLGMIKDKLAQGAEICNITKENQNIGFLIIQEKEGNVFDFVIAGLYPLNQAKGLGSNILTQALRATKDRGGKMLNSHVSINNRRSFALHVKCGFQCGNAEYLFVKHIESAGCKWSI